MTSPIKKKIIKKKKNNNNEKKKKKKKKRGMKTIRNQFFIEALIQTICPSIFPSLIIYLINKFKEMLSYL